LLIVAGIIVIGAAMAIPAIASYFRYYRIREAQSQVAGALQSARGRAISKNANLGVAFVVESPTRYWVHILDDQSETRSRDPQLLEFDTPVASQSRSEVLPSGVRFAQAASECPNLRTVTDEATAFAPTAGWFSFNRLGGRCVTGANCPTPVENPGSLTAAIMNNDALGGSLLCLVEKNTGLSRALVVSPGGRVRTTK
jgi:Tfp pilus assembly protein FimT